jgi:hypothetical protein
LANSSRGRRVRRLQTRYHRGMGQSHQGAQNMCAQRCDARRFCIPVSVDINVSIGFRPLFVLHSAGPTLPARARVGLTFPGQSRLTAPATSHVIRQTPSCALSIYNTTLLGHRHYLAVGPTRWWNNTPFPFSSLSPAQCLSHYRLAWRSADKTSEQSS